MEWFTPIRRIVAILLPALFIAIPLHAESMEQNGVTTQGQEGAKSVDFTLRWGEGGFKDGRSPLDKLGGGQLALDIKPTALPLALSISGESYTNGPEPSHPYEISDLTLISLLYVTTIAGIDSLDGFIGGGGGWLKVPKSEENPNASVESSLYALEAGVHHKTFNHFGFYSTVKYLHAQKDIAGERFIDFNEYILLIGITGRFSL